MAIKNAGTFLKLTEIAAEFNDPAPHQMSEFHRGAGRVVDLPTNAAIPTSGALRFGQFYGTGNAVTAIATSGTNVDVAPLFPGTFTNTDAKILTIASIIQIVGTNVALTVPSNMAGTLDIQNAGNIIGSSGNGGNAGSAGAAGGNASAGGSALSIQSNGVTITNSGTINGGGGGGAGGAGGAPTSGNVSGSFGPEGGGGWTINFANLSNPTISAASNIPGHPNVGPLSWNGPGNNNTTRLPGNGGYIDRGPKVGTNSIGNKTFNRAGGNFSVVSNSPGQAGGGGGNGYGWDGSSVVNAQGAGSSPGNGGSGGAGGGAGSAGSAGGNTPAASAGNVGAGGNSVTSPGSVNYTITNTGTINGTQG